MNVTKIFALAVVFALSSPAWAEGGGDRTFDRMMEAKGRAMEQYKAKQQLKNLEALELSNSKSGPSKKNQ